MVAHALAKEASLEDADPWSRRDGWRLHGAAVRRFDLDTQGAHHVARLFVPAYEIGISINVTVPGILTATGAGMSLCWPITSGI